MASANICKNVKDAIFVESETNDVVNLSSVLELSWDDATTLLQDGSDNDTSYTFTEPGPAACRGTLRLRDPSVAETLSLRKGDLTVTDVAAFGNDHQLKINDIAFGQFGGRGAWQTLREYPLNFQGGLVEKISAS